MTSNRSLISRYESGLALILIAGLLTLLAVVGSAFQRFSLGLREAGGLALDRTEARLLARSGVQYAASRLFQTSDVPKSPRVENQADDWTYRDGAGFPLEQARNPSYAQTEPYVDVDGNGRYDPGVDTVAADLNGTRKFDSWSGRLRDRHGMTTGTFALKVLPESGKININGGWLDAGNRNSDYFDPVQNTHYYNSVPDHCDVDEIRNRRYVLLLDTLGQILNVSTTSRAPNELNYGAASRLGDLLKGRPLGGFQSMGQVRGLLIPSDWEKVNDFLTVAETERAKFSVSDRTGMRGSSGYIRLLGTEARPLVNLGLAPKETLQALTLGLLLGDPTPGGPGSSIGERIERFLDLSLASKTADYLSQRRFASWYDFHLQLHRDYPSVDPQSLEGESENGLVSGVVRSWPHVVFGNFVADEVGGYDLPDDPDPPNLSFEGYDPFTYDPSPPMSWHTYDVPHASAGDFPHFRSLCKMGPSESKWGAANAPTWGMNIVARCEGGRPPLPPSSNQRRSNVGNAYRDMLGTSGREDYYMGGTLEASLLPREVAAASVDCLGRSKTAGGRLLASAAVSSLLHFGTIVSARTQEEFENLSGFRDLGRCKVIGRPFKDRMQTEPQFSVDSMRDLDAQLPADRSRYSPFWGTIRLADRSGYRQGERFYVPAWDVDQPLRPSLGSAFFEDNFEDASGSTRFVYKWNIFKPTVPPSDPFPPDKVLGKPAAPFRGDRAVSLQCAAAPGISAPGTYTWLPGKEFPLEDGTGNAARGTLELWTPGRPGGDARQLGLFWTKPAAPAAAADFYVKPGFSGSGGIDCQGSDSRRLLYGDWHHFVIVLDAGSTPAMVGYVDGISDPFLTTYDWASSAINTAHQPEWVMGRVTLPKPPADIIGGYYGIDADELRLYDKTLDQGEVMARAGLSRYWAGEHFPPSDWPQALQDRLVAVPSFTSPLYVFDRPVTPEGARWDGFVPQLIREAVDGSGAIPGAARPPSESPPIKVELLCWDHIPAGQELPQRTVPFPEALWRSGGGWAEFREMWRSAYGAELIPRFRAYRYKVWMDCSAIEGFNGETPVFDSISMVFKTGAELLDVRSE